ncbi:MAG TPA: hypothetical protein VG326_11735 [Tepidisphaeraceae bacterium]|jgi:hypothetical protein|nr:hypothetical protein [Tepidisphaeraceae bacterium]
MPTDAIERDRIFAVVQSALAAQPITDLHTHLYSPGFGTPVANAAGQIDPAGLMLWGVDELVTYHYLIAEVFRVVPATVLPYDRFFKLGKHEQADHIWRTLFVERTPISEACRGILTTLQKLGLDPNEKTLTPYRKYFSRQRPGAFVDRVMGLANVKSITMTNAVFDDNERARWLNDPAALADPRFRSVLRIDPLLLDYPSAAEKMSSWGYDVSPEIGERTVEEGRRFLREWIDRQKAIYVAVSLPPEFRYPAAPADAISNAGQRMLEKVVLPVCAERGLPFAMMIGSHRGVNPGLRDAGDMGGKADVASVVNLCRAFAGNKFMVTMLARENQHELCVAARKFGNLMIFGCWWFLNNPSLIEEIERMRFELLGTSFIPQHSDARVLDQLLYKWEHSRRIIGKVLAEKYVDLFDAGWHVARHAIERDVHLLLEGNFSEFLSR